jgi:hypothetical protein
MITELPSNLKTELATSHTHSNFLPLHPKDDPTPKRNFSPFYQKLNENTAVKNNHPTHKHDTNTLFANGIYVNNVDKSAYRTQQPKMQINFNGNLLMRTQNPYGNALENKSSIVTRNSHF